MNPHCARLETTSAKVILRVVFFMFCLFLLGKNVIFFKQIAVSLPCITILRCWGKYVYREAFNSL